jgi:GNAT superfamily N-acetyltransferase
MTLPGLSYKPVTPAEWDDLQTLFAELGSLEGCWCMWWRLKRKDFHRQFGEGNRQALKQIVDSGRVPGLLVYRDGRPIGWCSVGPREDFPVLDRSPVLKRVDDRPVWSIVCFVVAAAERRQGMMGALIAAAVDYARSAGATMVEAYPVLPEESADPRWIVFSGVRSAFERAGFVEVARRSKVHCIMRLALEA